MATGKQHDTATRICSVPATLATIATTGEFWPGVGVFLGFVVTLFVNPDLDIQGRTGNETYLRKQFGCLGVLWQAYWYPYALIIPHRGFLSHGLIIGTVVRFAYVFWPVYLSVNQGGQVGVIVHLLLWWCFVGMVISDVMHLIMDA